MFGVVKKTTGYELVPGEAQKIMKREEIAKKAIEKANQNGWGRDDISFESDLSDHSFGFIFIASVIFSHDFASAFFGNEDQGWMDQELDLEGTGKPFKAWQYHLRRMVLEEDPIKYLEKYL